MELYAGTTPQFVRDSVQNQIADKLRNAWFAHYRFNPSPGEIKSWQNSLRAMSQVVQYSDLMDHGILLEYQLPMTSRRIDCMLAGHNGDKEPYAVIVELKQWDKCAATESDRVVTWVGGGNKETLHPSVQSGQYRQYLVDCHSAFHEGDHIDLDSCSYLHNYSFHPEDPLMAAQYQRFIANSPVFSKDQVDGLRDYLVERLRGGNGEGLLSRIRDSRFRPSKKLMEHVGTTIREKSQYVLLDEQLLAYDKVWNLVDKGHHHARKHVVLVHGGPGTGKSVIAINLLADLSRKNVSANYATGSRAFTETLRKAIGSRASPLFKYFNSYKDAGPNEIDVLIADEAHRIREKSVSRFMKKADYPKRAQLQELIDVSKISVFLIDDDQVVRPNEIGSADYIRRIAGELGAEIHEYQLEAQFRCMGSDAFVNWVNNTLNIKRTANVLWEGKENFDFQIIDSPDKLEAKIREKVAAGHTGRVCAGYVWHWSDPRPDGTLPDDVVIGDYKRPWDARPEAKKLAPGIPPATLWAYEPGGIDQIGCVYNAQGFEFDYVGVIFGPDLRYNPKLGDWEGHPEESHDSTVKRNKATFLRNVKNTYRILLSRGIKGCYVYFMDEDTRNFFRSRMT